MYSLTASAAAVLPLLQEQDLQEQALIQQVLTLRQQCVCLSRGVWWVRSSVRTKWSQVGFEGGGDLCVRVLCLCGITGMRGGGILNTQESPCGSRAIPCVTIHPYESTPNQRWQRSGRSITAFKLESTPSTDEPNAQACRPPRQQSSDSRKQTHTERSMVKSTCDTNHKLNEIPSPTSRARGFSLASYPKFPSPPVRVGTKGPRFESSSARALFLHVGARVGSPSWFPVVAGASGEAGRCRLSGEGGLGEEWEVE